MSEAEGIIYKLAGEGKSAQAIAEELNARGVRGRGGRAFGASDIDGFLRFIDKTGAPVATTPNVQGAQWGSRVVPEVTRLQVDAAPVETQVPRKRYQVNRHFNMSAEQRDEVTRLYRHEHMSAGAIAEKLGLPLRRVNIFCGYLAGYDMPPGEITEITDKDGRKVSICPPAFARGVYPQRNVRTKGYY